MFFKFLIDVPLFNIFSKKVQSCLRKSLLLKVYNIHKLCKIITFVKNFQAEKVPTKLIAF